MRGGASRQFRAAALMIKPAMAAARVTVTVVAIQIRARYRAAVVSAVGQQREATDGQEEITRRGLGDVVWRWYDGSASPRRQPCRR